MQAGMCAVPAGMERVPMNREGQALRQLGTVSQLRQLRLHRERDALAARERTLADALLRQHEDEQLLQAQHQACRQRWLDWRAQGGALATALRWRAEREQLAELAALLAQRRAALHSASDFAGNGVGLASVRRIVRRHGGEIWAESEVGQGARFFFTLKD